MFNVEGNEKRTNKYNCCNSELYLLIHFSFYIFNFLFPRLYGLSGFFKIS